MQVTRLANWRAIEFSGDDRLSFLQGQLTQDLHLLADGHSPLAGWCNPRGRLEALGQLLAAPERIYWLLPAEVIAATVAAIGRFRLRARVEIDASPLQVHGLFELRDGARLGGLELSGASACGDGMLAARTAGDPSRGWLLAPAAAVAIEPGAATPADADWELADIRAGLPTVRPAVAGAFVPQMVNLDLLDGISFRKGCYVGQEVVARTQNLGRIKRRMFRFRSERRPTIGERLQDATGASAGQVVRSAAVDDGWELLAVVPLAKLDQLLTLGGDGPPLIRLPLPYEVPGTA